MNNLITDITKFTTQCHENAAYMQMRPVNQGERNLIHVENAKDVWEKVAKELELIVARHVVRQDLVVKENGILRAEIPVSRQINTLLRNSESRIRASIKQTVHAS